MFQTTNDAKIDPTFAAIEAHRRATAIRYPILETMGGTRDHAALARINSPGLRQR